MPKQSVGMASAPAAVPVDLDKFLTEIQTSQLLSVSRRTLQNWRLRGEGPRFVRCGRAIRYSPRDLKVWIDARTVANTGQEVAQ